jgi:hypothetical protein
MDSKEEVHIESVPNQDNHDHYHYGLDARIVPIQQEAVEDAKHINLSWRSWLVVFITCFAYETPNDSVQAFFNHI